MRKSTRTYPPGMQYFVGERFAGEFGTISSGGMAVNLTGVPVWRAVNIYVIVYVVEGCCDYEDERGFARRLVPGDLLHLFPGLRHTYPSPPGVDMLQYYANLSGPVFALLHERKILDEDAPVDHIEPVSYWLERMMSIIGPTPAATQLDANARGAAMAHLLVEARAASERSVAREEDWLTRAKAAIESGVLAGRPDWESIALSVGSSYEAFRKKFAELAGEPPGQYRQRRLIDIAREMIVHDNPTNRDLALALGFSDEFHFSRRFTAVTGSTPTKLRQQLGWRPATPKAAPRRPKRRTR